MAESVGQSVLKVNYFYEFSYLGASSVNAQLVNKRLDPIATDRDQRFLTKTKCPISSSDPMGGLFEYLADGACKKLISILVNYLKPGGRLILGNFDPSNPFRAFMDLGVEWFLIYRTQEQLKEFAKELNVRRVYCESEELGINNFLVIEKAA